LQVEALIEGSKSDAMLSSLSSFFVDAVRKETWR
jgi:hypothetical protein